MAKDKKYCQDCYYHENNPSVCTLQEKFIPRKFPGKEKCPVWRAK